MHNFEAIAQYPGPADFDGPSVQAWKLSLLAECVPVAMRSEAPTTASDLLICRGMIETGSASAKLPNLEPFQKVAEALTYRLLREGRPAAALAWGRASYIAARQVNHAWLDFFDIMFQCGGLLEARLDHVRQDPSITALIPSSIMQHRYEDVQAGRLDGRISWQINNPGVEYRAFDEPSAQNYLINNFGRRVAAAHACARTQSSRSVIFSLAWLLRNGGVYAETNEVCNASLKALLPVGCTFAMAWKAGRPSVFMPHFIATCAANPTLARLLRHVVSGLEWSAKSGNAIDEWMIYGPGGFTMTMLDDWCSRGDWSDLAQLRLLDHDAYRAVVDRSDRDTKVYTEQRSEEPPRVPAIHTIRIDGIIKPEDDVLRVATSSQRSEILLPEQILSPGAELAVVSADPAAVAWQERQRKHVLVPAAGVYWLNDLNLSGHACLWHGKDFVRLDSYLSDVAEGETRGGAWQTPWTHKVIRVVEEPVIVAFSPGYSCYGHWLVDELPRLGLLKLALGERFQQIRFVFPKKLRPWGKTLLSFFFDINEEQIIYFDHEREMWHLKVAIVPTFLHRNYNFQPFVREFFSAFAPVDAVPHRRVCLSRREWDERKPDQRIFTQRARFEQMAADRGYQVVAPEELSLADRVRLMAETTVQVGEHGSAQHGSIFSRYGTIVGSINPLTAVQINLGRIADDRNVLLFPDELSREESGSLRFGCSDHQLTKFFDIVEHLESVRSHEDVSALPRVEKFSAATV